MKRITKRIVLIATAAVATSIVAFTFAQSFLQKNYVQVQNQYKYFHKNKNKVSLLFVQQAKYAAAAPINNSKQCYLLTLKDVQPRVLYFSDQPKRLAGHITVGNFVNVLEHNTKNYGIRPNVAILAYKSTSGKQSEVHDVGVVLNPEYNSGNNSVTYKICTISGKAVYPAKKLSNVTLFFDNFRPWPP